METGRKSQELAWELGEGYCTLRVQIWSVQSYDHERNTPGFQPLCRSSERYVHEMHGSVNSQLPSGQWLTPTPPPPGQRAPHGAAAPAGPWGGGSWQQVHEDPSHKVGAAADSLLGHLLPNPKQLPSMLSRLSQMELMNLL